MLDKAYILLVTDNTFYCFILKLKCIFYYLLLQILPHVQTLFPLPCEKVFDVVLEGNSYRLFKLVGDENIYGCAVKNDLSILFIEEGSTITFDGYSTEDGMYISIENIKKIA